MLLNEINLMSILGAFAVFIWFIYIKWEYFQDTINLLFQKTEVDDGKKYRVNSLIFGSAIFFLFFLFLNNILAAILGFILILLYRSQNLKIKEIEYKASLEEQSEIALQMIASLYDVHKDIIKAFEGAAECVSPPMSDELKRVVIEFKAGKSINEALTDFVERVDNKDFEILCKGILLSEQYGSNTSEVVQEIAQIIRDRIILREELKNELKGQKLTVDIFLLLIPVVGTMLYLFSPEARHTMTQTLVGKGIIIVLIFIEYIAWKITRGQGMVEKL